MNVDVVDLACSVALAALAVVVIPAYMWRVVRSGAATDARIELAGGSPLLGKSAMEMGYWAMRPIARGLSALGAGANTVTWASLVLAFGAGIALSAGRFGIGAALSLVSSGCDALDGMIARQRATASDAGEVLDAAVDRYAELFFFAGVAIYERSSVLDLGLTLAATAGAVMVSYTTAKGEALGVDVPRGVMRRQERAVYLVAGAGLVPFVTIAQRRWAGPVWLDDAPLRAALLLVATAGNGSAIRRLSAMARAARRRGRGRALGPLAGGAPLEAESRLTRTPP
ncbi:MAG: CDP-alcohol phosphatidyltransferase family protein [Polyangiaceae bacterium]